LDYSLQTALVVTEYPSIGSKLIKQAGVGLDILKNGKIQSSTKAITICTVALKKALIQSGLCDKDALLRLQC